MLFRSLGTQLIAAEARRAERASNPDSLDLCFQGMAWIAKGRAPEYLSRARDYFDRAMTLDPGNIDALVWRAYVDSHTPIFATDNRTAQLGLQLRLGHRAG